MEYHMKASRRGLLLSFVSVLAIAAAEKASGTYLPLTSTMLSALDYGVKGDGTTNDTAAINSFLSAASTQNAVAYFPNKTYECNSGTITVPSGSTVLCAPTATFRRSVNPADCTLPTSGFFTFGSNCKWVGGTFTNTASIATSSTSNTVGTGSFTWTVPAGLGLSNGQFVRAFNTATPANYIEGTITSYAGTSLTLNGTFSNGSGTFNAWTFVIGAVYQTPIVLRGVSQVIIEGATLTGLWYEGFLFDGNGLTFANATRDCSFKTCYAYGVMNRAFDYYGNVVRCNLIDCHVISTPQTPTDYGCNMNAANNGGSQTVTDCNIVGFNVSNVYFQGIGIGDICTHINVTGCVINGVLNAAGVGVEFVYANGNPAQFCNVSNVIVQSAAGQGFAVFGCNHINMDNIAAFGCGQGIRVDTSVVNAQENQFTGFEVSGCTTGVLLGTGSVNTIVNGRAVSNTTNYTNSGTGTVGTVTTT